MQTIGERFADCVSRVRFNSAVLILLQAGPRTDRDIAIAFLDAGAVVSMQMVAQYLEQLLEQNRIEKQDARTYALKIPDGVQKSCHNCAWVSGDATANHFACYHSSQPQLKDSADAVKLHIDRYYGDTPSEQRSTTPDDAANLASSCPGYVHAFSFI